MAQADKDVGCRLNEVLGPSPLIRVTTTNEPPSRLEIERPVSICQADRLGFLRPRVTKRNGISLGNMAQHFCSDAARARAWCNVPVSKPTTGHCSAFWQAQMAGNHTKATDRFSIERSNNPLEARIGVLTILPSRIRRHRTVSLLQQTDHSFDICWSYRFNLEMVHHQIRRWLLLECYWEIPGLVSALGTMTINVPNPGAV